MSKLSAKDVSEIRDTIRHTGEFRVHLIYARSGTCTKARMWHHDGQVVGRADGGGYDKGGAALGQAIELFFAEELKAEGSAITGLYGARRDAKGAVHLDGSCGKECMLAILKALGFTDCNLYETSKLSSMVLARKPKEG